MSWNITALLYNCDMFLEWFESAIDFIVEGLEQGKLSPIIDSIWQLQDVVQAYHYMENNGQFGKIVVKL